MSETLFNKFTIYNALKSKLKINFKPGRELSGWYCLDGVKRFKFRVPRGRGKISRGFQNQIEDTSRLNNDDFEDLIRCPLTGPKYDSKMKELEKRNLI